MSINTPVISKFAKRFIYTFTELNCSHESPVARILLNITEEINVWLRENAIQGQLHPFITFDCGYWKEARFHELNQRVWGWSVPWKKRTLIEIQLEMLDFQPPK